MYRKDQSARENKSTPVVREAQEADIDRLVELEFETFHDVYETHPVDPDRVRAMLVTRLAIIQELMIVGEVDGTVEGVMASQRTSKGYSQVKSWEETTNNGLLAGTHEPEGKNFYIVNLAVTKKGSQHNLSDQLIAATLGRFVGVQGEEAQLLSRIPQFRQWTEDRQIDFDSLSLADQDALAEKYVYETKVVNGRERLYDGVLQRYVDAGARPKAILRDSYTDPSSYNYEVLCTYENPLPEALRKNRVASSLAGRAIRYASNHPWLLKKIL